MKLIYIEPKEIKDDFPILVLSSHTNKFISWAIRWFSKGSYNHIMWLYKSGFCASQGWVYARVPIEYYLRDGFKLKFYALKVSEDDKEKILQKIYAKLNRPKIKSRYDVLGIVGQFFGLRFINNPKTNYCSESVAEDLVEVFKWFPDKPSPADCNKLFKARPEDFEYLGHWLSD